jgi:DnaJ-class molecular chaperone
MNIDRDGNLPDHYALLQISPEARQIDIINAYRHAKLAYQQDSLAMYSLFSEQELESIQAQIEEAYYVLSDPEKRDSYDALHLPADTHADLAPEMGENVIPLRKRMAEHFRHIGPDHTLGQIAICSGEALKETREAQNITLEDIAEHTNISKHYLQAIEDENTEVFPESIYLKSYLQQYAREIGLDPSLVVQRYPPLADQEK